MKGVTIEVTKTHRYSFAEFRDILMHRKPAGMPRHVFDRKLIECRLILNDLVKEHRFELFDSYGGYQLMYSANGKFKYALVDLTYSLFTVPTEKITVPTEKITAEELLNKLEKI
jgi:hypothetical protein